MAGYGTTGLLIASGIVPLVIGALNFVLVVAFGLIAYRARDGTPTRRVFAIEIEAAIASRAG